MAPTAAQVGVSLGLTPIPREFRLANILIGRLGADPTIEEGRMDPAVQELLRRPGGWTDDGVC
jgi:hypothetical protein